MWLVIKLHVQAFVKEYDVL